jgi:hypothetical protein
LSISDGGSWDDRRSFQEWCEDWKEAFNESMVSMAITPLFDPKVIHLSGNEVIMQNLISRGIDPYSCQYRGENGCLIPRERRPVTCRTYMCNENLVDKERAV